MLHYQVVRTSPGGATLSNKMNNTVHYGHVRHTLALMCAKKSLLIFSSFLDIWENVEWPRFLDHPVRANAERRKKAYDVRVREEKFNVGQSSAMGVRSIPAPVQVEVYEVADGLYWSVSDC